MPELTLDEYKALRRSGLTAQQIDFMGDEAARAELSGYRQGQAAVGGAESRIQVQGFPRGTPLEEQGIAYEGAPDEPIEADPFLDPSSLLPAVRMGQAGLAVAQPVIQGIGRYAGPVAGGLGKAVGRRILGKGNFDDLLKGILAAGGRRAAPVAKTAAQPVAERAATAGRTKIGQMTAQELAGVPRGAAESRVGGELSERGAKEFAGYARRRAMALMEQAGLPKEAEASRKAISEILGREVKSRSSLTADDWLQVTEAANERIMEQAARKAAEKAAASATKKAEKAIPKSKIKAVPKKAPAGSAASRVAPRRRISGGPAMEVPGSLEAQLRQSVEAGEAISRLPADQQLAAWQMLRQAMGR